MVINLCWLGLEDTKQVGRVDKDDSYKDDNLGDKEIHPEMDGKPPTESRKSLFLFLVRNVVSNFPRKKSQKKITFF
jgi:hypothetical protein